MNLSQPQPASSHPGPMKVTQPASSQPGPMKVTVLITQALDMRDSGNAAVDVLRDFLSNDYMLAKCFYLQSLLINGLLSERPNMLPDFFLQVVASYGAAS